MSEATGPVREFPVVGRNSAPALTYLEAVESGNPPAEATPRTASTVLLLREAPHGGPQVFMQTRVAAMAFAAGATVFPGGGVDPRDGDAQLPMSGPELGWWSQRLGCDAELARELLAAACREVYEECGVLLAGRAGPQGHTHGESAESLLGGPEPAARAREALTNGDVSLTEVLRVSGLELRSELLTPFARWITPAYQPRRYDTILFLARMPSGQQADGESTETETAGWVEPGEVLTDLAEGRVSMMTPTVVALERLVEAGRTGAEWLASMQRREWHMGPVQPRLVRASDGSPTLLCEVR